MYTTLRAEAARYGITHKQMCDAAGISSKSLNNKLTARTQFKIGEMRRIRNLFPVHFSLDELFDCMRDTA